MYTSEEQIKTTAYSSFQIESAIAMWAKCIPNVHLQGIDFTPPQPQNRIPIDQTLEITSAQLQNFVKALFDEIKKIGCIVKHGLTYIEIIAHDKRNPTPALMNALKQANIDTKFYSCFGYNLMRIYSNGNIQFNDEVYCTNDETSHYDTKVDFSNAPYMRVNLGKYKLFAIPYTEGEALYSGWVDKKAIVQLGLTPYTPDEVTGTLYMSIKLDDFLGSEEELLRMTAEDLKDILKDESRIKQTFKAGAFISLDKNRPSEVSIYRSPGNFIVRASLIGLDYYQEQTDPIRLLQISKQGTILDSIPACKDRRLIELTPNSYIFLAGDEADTLNYFCVSPELNSMELLLCDSNGNLLPGQIYCWGEDLPEAYRLTRGQTTVTNVGFGVIPRNTNEPAATSHQPLKEDIEESSFKFKARPFKYVRGSAGYHSSFVTKGLSSRQELLEQGRRNLAQLLGCKAEPTQEEILQQRRDEILEKYESLLAYGQEQELNDLIEQHKDKFMQLQNLDDKYGKMYDQYKELERNWAITSASYIAKSQSINIRKHSFFSNIKYHFNNNDNQREFNKSMLIAPGIFLGSSLIILGCIVLIPTINTFLLPMPIAIICIGVTLIIAAFILAKIDYNNASKEDIEYKNLVDELTSQYNDSGYELYNTYNEIRSITF